MMNIQIFGTKKCKETAKALRFFKERRIEPHFVNLAEKPVSKGELNAIAARIPLAELIDRDGKEYEKQNLKYIQHDITEKLLEYPLLFRTPIVRCGQDCTIGYQPDVWMKWIAD